MLRRSFLGAVLSSVPLLGAQASLIWVGDNYIRDPFIKICISQDKIVNYNNHLFTQSRGKYVLHYIRNQGQIKWSNTIPLDTKVNQKTKEDMIKELSKYKFKYECFEFIADNGKSNLYAICDNDKFQANLKGNGKSQCQIQLN